MLWLIVEYYSMCAHGSLFDGMQSFSAEFQCTPIMWICKAGETHKVVSKWKCKVGDCNKLDSEFMCDMLK